jgi:hypothetical protein
MGYSRDNPPSRGSFIVGAANPGFFVEIEQRPGRKLNVKLIEKEDIPFDIIDKLEQLAIERKKLAQRMDVLQANIAKAKQK